jgi:transcription termination/antitermination protein NusG
MYHHGLGTHRGRSGREEIREAAVAEVACRTLREQDLFEGGSTVTMTEKGRAGECAEHPAGHAASGGPAVAQWYALYTRSHCEQLVHDQLRAKGFAVFLPKLAAGAQPSGKRSLSGVPLFPSYLFLHHIMERVSYVEVCKARGLVRVLGERWDRLGIIPEHEIEAIQHLLQGRLPVLPYPYLQEGQRVRITQGPLSDTEGIFVQRKPGKGLVVLSIELLQRSVAVEVDGSGVTAS